MPPKISRFAQSVPGSTVVAMRRQADELEAEGVKIIDFGRCIFTHRKKTFMNDCFSQYGEAEGQYVYPPQVN